MSDSRTTIYRSPTWPPDYSSYTGKILENNERMVFIFFSILIINSVLIGNCYNIYLYV